MPDEPATLSARASARQGAVTIAPITLGTAPFGAIAGLATIEAGMGLAEALGFSTLLFAGASQLAAIDLLSSGAPVWVALLTVLVINARMLMYSATLAPHLADQPLRRRAAAGYLITDHAFAVSITRFLRAGERVQPFWYYLGAATTQWVGWQLWTVLGALAGGAVPEHPHVGFAVPLAFLALLVPAITDRATVAAAVVAASVATALVDAPANLGMPAAAVSGIVAGTIVARRGAWD